MEVAVEKLKSLLTKWKSPCRSAGSLLRHHLLLSESRLHQNLHPTPLLSNIHLQLDKASHSSRHRRRLNHWSLACHIGLHRMCPSCRLLGLGLFYGPRKDALLPPRQRVVGKRCPPPCGGSVHHGPPYASSFQTEPTTAPEDRPSRCLCLGILVSREASPSPLIL